MDSAEEAKELLTHMYAHTTEVVSLAAREAEVITVPSQLNYALY